MHAPHPAIHEQGLSDECEACSQIALNPINSLDTAALRATVRLALDPNRFGKGRSENELVAAANVLTVLEKTGRLFEVAPYDVARYLENKWRINLKGVAS